jgi:predicted nucleic acid-binding protein
VTGTRADVVLDASAGVRFVLGLAPDLRRLFEDADVSAPDLFALEAANALRAYAARGDLTAAAATDALADLLALPIALVPSRALATGSLGAALELSLTAYDAAYVMLARSLRVTLVTADRRLAAAYEPSRLVC